MGHGSLIFISSTMPYAVLQIVWSILYIWNVEKGILVCAESMLACFVRRLNNAKIDWECRKDSIVWKDSQIKKKKKKGVCFHMK